MVKKSEKKRTKCEIFTRIVGYLRPVNLWNEGKQAEFRDRIMFLKQKRDNPLQNPHLKQIKQANNKENSIKR